ncbi:unnamed protein product [Phytophthora lilii]|uniref:Unnamed protein product n=1 Tax=Phytophthora lilii TaxID=2077276 RepID=A0A9W6XFH5_9STRA|nr:unnamed protein product [Phytophthora lilii]
MPDRSCTFDPGNDPLRPISLRPQGLSRVTKVWRQLQGNPVGRSESSDLGFASWKSGHWIRLEPSSIGWMPLLRRLARTLPNSKRSSRLGLNSIAPETFAPTATVSKFPTVIGTRNYFALGSGAFEPPDTAWHSSSCFSAAPVDDESKGDSPQSSVAAAAALVGAVSSTGDVSETSVTDTPVGSSRPRPDLSDLADAATAATL